MQKRQHSKAKYGSSSDRLRALNGTSLTATDSLSGYAQLDIPRSPRIHGSEILLQPLHANTTAQYTSSCLSRGNSMSSIHGAAAAAAVVATPRTAAFVEATSVSKVSETANGVRLEDVTLSGFVTEVFAGITRSEVVCLNPNCHHVSATFERFLDVSLSLNGTDDDENDTAEHTEHTDNSGMQHNDDAKKTDIDNTVNNINSKGTDSDSDMDIDTDIDIHTHNQNTAAGSGNESDYDGTTTNNHGNKTRIAAAATAERSLRQASKGSNSSNSNSKSTANVSVPLTRAAAASCNSKAVQLTSLIDGFTAVEQLPHGVKCDACNAADCMKTKQMSFSSLPLVLIIQLKRFDALTDRKLNDIVNFPLQGLDMSPYITENINGNSASTATDTEGNNSTSNSKASTAAAASASAILYDLYAVINHSGSLSQGHYTCYVQESNAWYQCDDTWVCEADEQQVSDSQPYILFYRKSGIKGW
jgi:Ubiquitin carboxyl-terminal hydrolase